jgi:hypothetical protein
MSQIYAKCATTNVKKTKTPDDDTGGKQTNKQNKTN